ncbi:MAG TPA: DUF4386 family protein [Candidatus Bathyarchaeia archaeon]|jgi:hypothetical protein|nr:DUF4386 family protein [Candidatus Bathyarchaeia archaeon]
MTSGIDSSWRSLYKSGGFGMLIAGVLSILNAVAQAIIYSQKVSYNPKTVGDLLTFALTRTNLYYLQYYSAGTSMLFILPGIMALYFVLSHKDKGLALIGSALGTIGITIYLSNLADHLFFVQEATTYAAGCTTCSMEALAGAAGSFSVTTADVLAGFALGIAIVILSFLMYTEQAMSRPIALIGLLAGFVLALVYPTIALTSGPDLFFYAGLLSTIIPALWFFGVAAKLYRIVS